MKQFDLKDYSFVLIEKIFDELDPDEVAFLLSQQTPFMRKCIEPFVDPVKFDFYKKAQKAKKSRKVQPQKIRAAIVKYGASLGDSGITSAETRRKNSLLKALNSTDAPENIEVLIELIELMAAVSRREGLVELDFMLLREKRPLDAGFKYLLTSLLFGKHPKITLKNSPALREAYKNRRFIRVASKGIEAIQTAVSPDKIRPKLSKVP